MSAELILGLLFICMLILLFSGLPVAFAIGGTAALFALLFWGPAGTRAIPMQAFAQLYTVVLIAIPMFVFMGEVLGSTGVMDDIFKVAHTLFGKVRGGLAVAVILACTLFAAMAGVSSAAVATMGIVALGPMMKRGYDAKISAGSILSGGALAAIIPPSVTTILYAIYTNGSVGRLYAGGYIPGLMIAVLGCIYILVICRLRPSLAPVAVEVTQQTSRRGVIFSIIRLVPYLIIIFVVVGTVLAGLATPTEAAGAGAVVTVLITVCYGRFNWRVYKEVVTRTFATTGMILWIVIGASVFTSTLFILGGGEVIKGLIVDMGISPIIFVVLIQVLLFFLGMFLETTSIILIFAPIAYPIVQMLNIDPVWFGILFIISMQMAFITPPFGIELFVLKGVFTKETSIKTSDVWRATLPFVGIDITVIALCIIFPQVITAVPNMIYGVAK